MNRGRNAFYHRLWERVAPLQGDVAECGVGKGKSLRALAEMACDRTVWALESWREFPPLSEGEDTPEVKLTQGLVVGDKAAVLERLDSHAERVRFVDGYLSDTLPSFRTPLTLVNVDVDLYSSYRDALRYLWPLLVPGGVMVFDEYHEPKYPGARRAVDEYLATVPHELHEDLRWWAVKP